MPIMNVGGMQLFKVSSNDTAEKILPNQKKFLKTNFIYTALTFLCAFLIKFLV